MAVEAKALFEGHEIVARITGIEVATAKLYIDGKVIDTASKRSGTGALLRGYIEGDGKTHIVEVHRRWPLTKPRILIDGEAGFISGPEPRSRFSGPADGSASN
jgi:hypothetical protein